MPLDRVRRNAVRGEPLTQPTRVIGQHEVGGIGLEKPFVMPRALRLLAVGLQQRPVEGVRMRPRQHRERGDPLRISVGQRPGDAAAPVVTGKMKARLAIA